MSMLAVWHHQDGDRGHSRCQSSSQVNQPATIIWQCTIWKSQKTGMRLSHPLDHRHWEGQHWKHSWNGCTLWPLPLPHASTLPCQQGSLGPVAIHRDREAQDRHPAAALSLTSLEVDMSLVSLSPGRKLGLDDCRRGRGGAYGDLPSDLSRICIPPPAISFAHLENTSGPHWPGNSENCSLSVWYGTPNNEPYWLWSILYCPTVAWKVIVILPLPTANPSPT